MKNILKASAIAIAALSVASCVKVPLHNTQHPDKGAVVLTADFSVPSNVTAPTSYSVTPMQNQQAVQTLSYTAKTNVLPLFVPGEYFFMLNNSPESVDIASTTATVRSSAGVLATMPGWLFSGSASGTVIADDTVRVTVPLKNYMYELEFEMPVVEGNVDVIQSWEAKIDGIACKFDLATSTLNTTESAEIKPQLTMDANGTLRGNVRILGFAGSRQLFTLVLNLKYGDPITVPSDFSNVLKDKNPSTNPFIKLIYEIHAPVDGNITGTIGEWVVVEDEYNVD